jgi:hypothetical protein
MATRADTVRSVTEALRVRSAPAREHYLAFVRESAEARDRTRKGPPRVALLAPEGDGHGAEPDVEALVQALVQAGARPELAVRLPESALGFATSEDEARERRSAAALTTSVGLGKGHFELVVAPALTGDGAVGVLVGCLRFGHLPMLLMPGSASSSVVSRAAFETDVLLAALRLYDPSGALPADAAQRPAFLRDSSTRALATPPAPLAAMIDEDAIVQGILALLAIGAGRPRLRALVALSRAAAIRIQRSDLAELAETVPAPHDFGNAVDGPTRPLAVVRTLRARGVLDASG